MPGWGTDAPEKAITSIPPTLTLEVNPLKMFEKLEQPRLELASSLICLECALVCSF